MCLLYSNELHTDLIPVEHLMGGGTADWHHGCATTV